MHIIAHVHTYTYAYVHVDTASSWWSEDACMHTACVCVLYLPDHGCNQEVLW